MSILESSKNALIGFINEVLDEPLTDTMIATATFSSIGLDSETAVIITGQMSDYFDIDIDPVSVFEKPLIIDFSRYVAELRAGSED
jgi:acyl carrier protein